MSGKIKILSLGLVGALVILAGIILVLNADPPGSTDIILKARFISGNTLNVWDPQDPNNPDDDFILPNRIVNDIENLYYQNGTGVFIALRNDPGKISYSGGYLDFYITTDRRSPRYVNLYFDSVVDPAHEDLKSVCGNDYFLDPAVIAPIGTTYFWMKSGGEWEWGIDPDEPKGLPVLKPKGDAPFNFITMADGQEAYVYIDRFKFSVPDDKLTKYNETRDVYTFADCCWVKVKASDWDGEKVNTWTLTPVTEPFKHGSWDPNYEWCEHPNGAIPYRIYSSAYLSCNHGTYRMPWQLVITRLP